MQPPSQAQAGYADLGHASGVVQSVLSGVVSAKIAVVGDFCLDAYWELEADWAQTSIETGLAVRRVVAQRYELGGAGNVAGNLRAIGVGA